MYDVAQDIIDDDEIKLDWFFKASMINDLVNVRVCNLLLPVVTIIAFCFLLIPCTGKSYNDSVQLLDF